MLTISVEKIKSILGKSLLVDVSACLSSERSEGLNFVSPVRFVGSAKNEGDCIEISGELRGELKIPCDRCGEMVQKEFETPFCEWYCLEGEKLDPKGEHDIYAFWGDTIDISSQAAGAFFIALPPQFLCGEDCLGLCAGCGANLNTESCCCAEPEIDPRLAKLKEFVFED